LGGKADRPKKMAGTIVACWKTHAKVTKITHHRKFRFFQGHFESINAKMPCDADLMGLSGSLQVHLSPLSSVDSGFSIKEQK